MPELDRASKLVRPAKQYAIRLRGVSKEYKLYPNVREQALDVLGLSALRFWRQPDFRVFRALDGIDLDIGVGERVGIVGRNGAGKTTLLKLITGNFAPTQGEVSIAGKVQALMATGIGFHSDFTGAENIRASLLYNGLSSTETDTAVDEIVDFCELGDFLYQPVKTYSLGMRARLQFACATAIKPDILIIDEVLGAGNSYFASRSMERMKSLTRRGQTLLIVSHSSNQILQFSDRVIWLDKGQIVASGDPLHIVNMYEEFSQRLLKERQQITETTTHDAANVFDIPQWVLQKQFGTDKIQGADWGGAGPLRIQKLYAIDQFDNARNDFPIGTPFSLIAEISSSEAGCFDCSCIFVMYDEAGNTIMRSVEPECQYYIRSGETIVVKANYDLNPLGAGVYFVSAGLFRDYVFAKRFNSHRYHILGRALTLKIHSALDDCRIAVPVKWERHKFSFEGAVAHE